MKTILTLFGCLVLCMIVVFLMVGCGKGHIRDGPGMINPASWNSFTVSRNDSYAQHNFCITVEERNEGLFVTGEVRGEDGTIYTDEEGILLPKKEADQIYALEPALLPDCKILSAQEDAIILEGGLVLDQGSVSIEVICTDGRVLEKTDEDDFSIKVYQIVTPCFEKKYNSQL